MQQICKKLTRLIQCAVLTLAAMTSLNAWGLSLGDIALESTLNQPLRASIVLGNAQRLTPQDVRVGLAPKTAFEAMGVDLSSNLSDLDFLAVSSGSGLRIELSTPAPIVEPYLNFVLELVWPNGRLVREYTLLLDPPVLMAPVRPLDIAPVQAASVRPVSRVPEVRAQRLDADRMTQAGDTLWNIALAARPDRSTSVQAMMLAIQSRNPGAFMNQNINRLKAGYVLVMPDQDDLGRISFESAVAEVASQNTEQMQPARQKKNAPIEPSVDSELVLVAVDAAAPNVESFEVLAATDSAEETDNVEEQKELINSAAIERDLLAGRMAALETKLESLAGTISLKDQQIAALQKQLKTLEALPKVAAEQRFVTPLSIAFMVALVILVVVLLLMSARYQRLTRSLRVATASGVAAEPQGSSPTLAAAASQPNAALAGTDPLIEIQAAGTTLVPDAADEAERGTPEDTEDLSPAKTIQMAPADAGAQVEADFPELDLSALDGLDDLSELETLGNLADIEEIEEIEGIEALDGLEMLEELEDPSALETLDLSDMGDLSEADVASELGIDPDEDPANMLDLARAYVDMGDADAARRLLNRVGVIGTPSEATEAQKMLVSLSED